MDVNINKLSYNSFKNQPMKEKITVEISGKFGTAKKDTSVRAYFFEVNIDAKNLEDDTISRSLLLEVSFHYKLHNDNIVGLTDEENEEDSKYFKKCLEKLNEIVVNISSQDGKNPFDITKAIENFEES